MAGLIWLFQQGPTVDITTTTVAVTVDIEDPSIIGDSDAVPTTVAAAAVIETPVVAADANVTTDTVTGTTLVDIPVVSSDATEIIPTTVAGITDVPTPVVFGDANITTTTVASLVVIEAPTIPGNVDITPDTVRAYVGRDSGVPGWGTGEWGSMPWGGGGESFRILDPPTVTATGGADATITTSTVAAAVSIPAPEIFAGDVSITPDTVFASVSIPTPAPPVSVVVRTISFRYRAPVGYKSRRTGVRMPRGRFEPSVRI